MAPEGDSRPSLGKAPDADGLFRFFKRQVPSPAKAPDAGGLFRFFKKTTVADMSRSSGRETSGLNTPEAKGLHVEIDSAVKDTNQVVKTKRRLQMWKKHAAEMGTEAPKPSGAPPPPAVKSKKRRTNEEDAIEVSSEKVRKLDEEQAEKKRKKKGDVETMRKAAEQAAEEALANGDASLEALQRALDLLEVPASANRKNVIPRGQTEVRGLLFGLYCYGGTLGVSSATGTYPNICKLLISALRAVDKDFPFTGIQLNYNYASRPHVDKNNCGCSYIVGFGNYTGGELWMHDSEAGEDGVSHTLDPEDDDVTAAYPAGDTFSGRVEDINGNWTQFDGNKLHFTQPFSGNRYSVIYFTCDQYAKADKDVRTSLLSAGFDFDWDSTQVEETLRQKLADRQRFREELSRQRAEEALKERMRRGRCIARIWADGWGHQCTAICTEGEDMCQVHVKGGRWKTHGRFDGDLPPAKKDEMRRTQQKWIKQGKRPPPDEPWTPLVDVPPPPC